MSMHGGIAGEPMERVRFMPLVGYGKVSKATLPIQRRMYRAVYRMAMVRRSLPALPSQPNDM